jgi:hypothetical protein
MVRAGKVFAVRAGRRRTTKVQVRRTAKKRGTAKVARTAKKCGTATGKTHGKVLAHGNGVRHTAKDASTAAKFDARQRFRSTAKALPSGLDETHGKESVAGQYIAVRSLPCVDARQRLRRAFWILCRAFCPHGKDYYSGSDLTIKMGGMNYGITF